MHNPSTRLFMLLVVSFVVSLSGCYPPKSVRIHGQIVDDKTGQPVSNATVCLHSRYTTLSNTRSDNLTAKTNAEGKFEFPQLRMRKAVIPNTQTYLRLCAMKKGYDWTELQFDYSGKLRKSLEVRLEPDRDVGLPQGWFSIDHDGDRIRSADEPTFRFAFKEEKLQIVGDNEQSDLELHYKFIPENDRITKLFGRTFGSKSGRRGQFLESITSAGGLGLVSYQRTNGHPPRLPDLATIEFSRSFSCDRPYDWHFSAENEFLLKTQEGKFALLHFDGESIRWVYQPNCTLDIDRRRKHGGRHCEHCNFRRK